MIRRVEPRDIRFLRDMLHHAFYRREAPAGRGRAAGVPLRDRLGADGRRGVLALDEGFPVGAAWYRLFKQGEPGYGFVDEETPELAIAIVPSRRGRGLGKELLEGLIASAKRDGFQRLSLSVDRDNPAIGLYESFGFQKIEEHGRSWTMLAEL